MTTSAMLAFVIYGLVSLIMLFAIYRRIDWRQSEELHETKTDIMTAFTVALFWPVFFLLNAALSVGKFIHKALVRLTS